MTDFEIEMLDLEMYLRRSKTTFLKMTTDNYGHSTHTKQLKVL